MRRDALPDLDRLHQLLGQDRQFADAPVHFSPKADRERQYLALCHTIDPDVASSDVWKKTADTPWTERMRPHFRDLLVIRCRRYVRQ